MSVPPASEQGSLGTFAASGAAAPAWLRRTLYWLGKNLFLLLGRVVWRLHIRGAEFVPMRGAVIVACNHISLLDPPILGASLPRPAHYMAKQKLFEVPVFGWLIRQVNAFPLRRGERDISAFKTAQRLLSQGEAVIVFPEGTRSRSGELRPAKPGVGMLAARTGAAVVPACIENTHRAGSFRKFKVWFAKPLHFPKGGDYQEFSSAVMGETRRLQEEMRRDL